MDTKLFESYWLNNGVKGVAKGYVPKWAKLRMDMSDAFPSPYRPREGQDPLAREIYKAISLLDELKPEEPDKPQMPGEPIEPTHAYLGDNPSGPHYEKVEKAELNPDFGNVSDVVKESVELFNGAPHWNHPLTMPNVIPPSNIAGIIAAMMTEVFSPNIIEGEYSWNVSKSELESAAMLAKLIGWDPSKARGLYTFGGSGCYFYGLKYALTRVLPNSRNTGIRTDAKLLVSQQGHYCKQNASDWTGLGMDNIVEIKTDIKTNAMDLNDLEEKLKDFHEKKIPVVSVVCTMGTTDANAMDPVGAIRELIEKYPNPSGYGKTFLYCDSVIGWSWLTFSKYDFKNNPLGFSEKIRSVIEKNYDAIKDVVYADAIGCDFHKSGWAPYNCSLFVYKDRDEFEEIMKRPSSSYLQDRTTYNPGLYTLEVSRSGAYSMAGWATLKYFGYEGFQAILGSILEMQQYLREIIKDPLLLEDPLLDQAHSDIVCVNSEDHGFVTLFRVYPKGTNAEEQYKRELNDEDAKEELIENNKLQERVANTLWGWFRDGGMHAEGFAPYISYTTGFRPTEYNRDKKDEEAVIFALKSFPMNVNIDPTSMQTLLKMVRAARDVNV